VITPRGANVYDEPGDEEKEETGGQRSQYQYHVSDDLPDRFMATESSQNSQKYQNRVSDSLPDSSLRHQSTLPGARRQQVGSKQKLETGN
jgi:hypothetical protein